MTPSPTVFTTPRLVVRRALPEDAEFFYRLWRDSRVMSNVGFPAGLPVTRDQVEAQIYRHAENEYNQKLVVTLAEGGEPIGRPIGEPIGECMLGWPDEQGISLTDVKLMPDHWGKRYGLEVKQGLVDYLFSHAPCLAVEADPAATNLPSIRMQQAVGGLLVREYDSDFAHHLVYRVHRFDWERLKAGLPVAPEPLRSLLAEILPDLVPGSQALALTGSFARGCANPYSDLDLFRFVDGPVESPHEYRLHPSQRRLISLSTAVLSEKLADLQKPANAMWAAPCYAQCWVLFDRAGGLAQLKAQAAAYDPAALRAEADAWISDALKNIAEEVTKVLAGLQRDDEGAALYSMMGIEYILGLVAGVHLGLLFETENDFFEQIRRAAPPQFTHLQRVMMGFEPASVSRRGRAALGLYRYTCRWLDALILPQHRAIVEYAAGLIPPAWEAE